MKILLGIQTTGNGHIVRSRALSKQLRELGADIHCVLTGPSTSGRWQLDDFEPYETRAGLSFGSHSGKISYWRTALHNKPVQFIRDVHSLNWQGYDLVISDYEPVTAWMARKRGLPSIGIGHLYAFIHDVPKSAGNQLAHWVTNVFAPVKYAIGSHWHHFDQPLLPPTVAEDIHALNSSDAGHFLVYLPFEQASEVIALLKQFPQQNFRFYTGTMQQADMGHIQLCQIGREGFINDLASCRGVICNAGFSLVSEALYLGKKVLVKPLTGQVEQESNAVALEHLQLGHWMAQLNRQSIERWLDMPAIDACQWPDVMEPLAEWIMEGNWDEHQALIQTLWANQIAVPA